MSADRVSTDAPWPVGLADVAAARDRIAPHLAATPLRHYPELDAAVGNEVEVLVKHENHHPTNSFKVRNAFAALTALDEAQRRRGVVAGTRGNHGQGLAYAGQKLGIPVTVCVPHGNVADKNRAMRGYGAEVIATGADYDEAAAAADRLAGARGLTLVHSTNNRDVLAGAGTITLEALDQDPSFDAVVVAIGGGSQAVGALTVLRALKPETAVFGVQSVGAAAVYESWRAGRAVTLPEAQTFADGIATRSAYAMTLPALRAGLSDFVTVTDDEIATALRVLLSTTHNLVEGAGAAGLAGLHKLSQVLAGKRVMIVLSGGNIARSMLRDLLNAEP